MAAKKPTTRRGGRGKGARPRDGTGRNARRAESIAAPAAPSPPVEADPSPRSSGPLVVAVGASAGGLEAFGQLLHEMPERPGLAIVVIAHLAPQHESAMPSLLAMRTRLPVVQAAEGMRVEANRVYVIPPNVQMSLVGEQLHLSGRPTDRTQYTPIDFFLRSLADAVQERAVAVILSGTASDGTAGVRDVKAAGGVVFAQTPETARYDGMPRAAVATGLVDLVLSPAEIASELVHLVHVDARHRQFEPSEPLEEEPFRRILALLRGATSVDFARYKRPTVERRLHRRMALHKFGNDLEGYLRHLRENPNEVQALYRDILIHVTRFFRDPESFEALKSLVFPKILGERYGERPVRIWVPGCSTGEEAYSSAIVLLEVLGERAEAAGVQIFATDVSETAIEHARAGLYPETIAADVGPERLRRFFHRADGGLRVTKALRDQCVFARQDLTREPPFSKLDLVICRNVLIYMGAELQKKLMSVFHYALRPDGFLMLGSAESIGFHSELFTIADKRHRIYRKLVATAPAATFPVDPLVPRLEHHRDGVLRARPDDPRSVFAEASRVVQDRFSPPGVIVDQDLQIVQYRGQTGAFLQPAPGEPSASLLKMAREGLLHGLRSALQEARRDWTPAHRDGLRVRTDGGWRSLSLHVLPIGMPDRPHFLLLFDESGRAAALLAAARPRRSAVAATRERESERVVRLQQELATSREYLQSIIQELEAANEELQSANEEILSANEELQSTNEELDTAKEELQSTNEELNTVNDELHSRNDELTRVNSDLVNLLGSVQIAIVIVAADLRIRRFTPMAEKALNLIASDVGRPIGHIKPNIDCSDLEELIGQVVETVTPYERDVRDREGNWLLLRIRPYKNVENRIDGAVLALFAIDPARMLEERVRRAEEAARVAFEFSREPLLLLDGARTVRAANGAFCGAFGLTIEEVQNRALAGVGDGRWGGSDLEASLGRGDGAALEHEVAGDGRRWRVEVRRIGADDVREAHVILAFRPVEAAETAPA